MKPRRLLMWTAILVVGATGLGAAYWLQPGTRWFPKCVLYVATGLYCPGCGAGRALHALLHGQWLVALRMNPLLLLLGPILLASVASALVRDLRGDGSRPPTRRAAPWLLWLLVAVVIVYTVLRNLPGMEFLRPY